VRLTPIGASVAAEVRTAVERLARATSNAIGPSSRKLSVSTIDSFADRGLLPRLHRFRQAHGDIDVRVAVSATVADFVDDGIDIAIRCGGGEYSGPTAELQRPRRGNLSNVSQSCVVTRHQHQLGTQLAGIRSTNNRRSRCHASAGTLAPTCWYTAISKPTRVSITRASKNGSSCVISTPPTPRSRSIQ
jgi:DNA-binding transcriptional LysR family regulator